MPVYRALQLRCTREVAIAQGIDPLVYPAGYVTLPWYMRLTANWLHWPDAANVIPKQKSSGPRAMTLFQRLILVTTASLILAAGVCPPFEITAQAGVRVGVGFGWLFKPPDGQAQVNSRQLGIEWVGLLVVGALLWLAASPQRREPPAENPLKHLGKQVADALNDVTHRD